MVDTTRRILISDAHDQDSKRGRSPDEERTRDPVVTRRRLLDAAGRLIDERGDLGLRVVDVAEEAGTSVGTIYVHFHDRDALVAAVHAERFQQRTAESAAQLRSILEAGLDPENRDRALLELFSLPDDPAYREVRWGRIKALAASREDPMLAEVVDQSLREIDEMFVALLDQAKEVGLVRPDIDSRAGSLFVQALSLGLVLTDARRDPPPSAEAWMSVVAALMAGVAPTSERG